jgi:hypothetical protein
VGEAQPIVQRVLTAMSKRWVLDDITEHSGKPSEMYYLVRLNKRVTRDDLITAIRAEAGGLITSIELEIAEHVVPDEEAA